MNNQSMLLSSTRPAISTFVADANSNNCMKEKPNNNLLVSNSGIDVPFSVGCDWQASNLIGDSTNIQDGPRAVMVTGSGEKYVLPSEEEEMEKSTKEHAFYFKSEYDSQDAQSKTSRVHRRKTSKNSYNHSSQKGHLSIAPRICNSFHSTHSHHNTSKSSSKSSNIGTQTPLKEDTLNTPAIERSANSRRYPYTIAEESPLQRFNEISELNNGQILPYPSVPLCTTVAELNVEPKTSYRNIWKDTRFISSVFSAVSVLFWVVSIYFELRVVTELFENIVYKIRSLFGIPEPQKTKFQIFKDFIYKMLM